MYVLEKVKLKISLFRRIEQEGMTFDHNFGCSLPLLSSLLKKRGEKKRRMNSKNRDQKSCISARSFVVFQCIEKKLTFLLTQNVQIVLRIILLMNLYNKIYNVSVKMLGNYPDSLENQVWLRI